MAVTRSELISRLRDKKPDLTVEEIDQAVREVLDFMANSLAQGKRIEIRGFGSFDLVSQKARIGRNPKTGEPVEIPPKYKVHFKPGKELKNRVQQEMLSESEAS